MHQFKLKNTGKYLFVAKYIVQSTKFKVQSTKKKKDLMRNKQSKAKTVNIKGALKLYIYFACLSVCLFVCLSNKRQTAGPIGPKFLKNFLIHDFF